MSLSTNITVEPDVLMYAFRYSLGRRTYAPTDVQAALRANMHRLEERTLEQVITEVTTAVHQGDAGMVMDAEQWLRFVKEVESHLASRRSQVSLEARVAFIHRETKAPSDMIARMLELGWVWDDDERSFQAPKNP